MSRRKRDTDAANARKDPPARAKPKRARAAPKATQPKSETPAKPPKPESTTKRKRATKSAKPGQSKPAVEEATPIAAAAAPPPPLEPRSSEPAASISAPDTTLDADAALELLNRPLGADEWIPIPLEDLLRQMQSAPAPTTARASAAWMTIPLAAALAGLAAGWQWFGYRMMAGAMFDPLPGTSAMLATIALLAAASGPWLPLKALPRLGHWLERRWARADQGRRPRDAAGDDGPAQPSWLHRVVRERDEPLLWTSVATLAAVAGGMAVLMLALSFPCASVYRHLLKHFFWTDVTLAIVEWTGAILVTAPMWLINGLVFGAVVLAAARRWPFPQAGAAVVIGGTIGWAIADASHHQWTDLGLSCEQQILLGIVPMFLLAGLGVLMSQDAARAPADQDDNESETPETADGNERLVWLALLVWAIGSGLAFCGWTAGRDLERLWSGPGSVSDGSAYPLLLAGGAMFGWLSVRQRIPGGAGCGMAVWAAGIGAGLAATLAAAYPGAARALRSAVLAAPAGYALAYAQTAWLARAGRRGQAMAGMALAVLAGMAIGLAIAEWLALPLLGPVGCMAAGALALLAFGGLVQIFARAPSGATRHIRLGLIFASLAAALAIFPSDVRHWSQACAAQPAPGAPVEPTFLVSQATTGARRFCAIGAQRTDLLDSPGLVALTYSFPPTPADATMNVVRQDYADACQTLRQSHDYYDLIYQHGQLPAAGPRYLGYSLEWLRGLVRHRAAGGRVVLDVVPEGLNAAARATIAATFQLAMGEPCVWQRTEMQGRAVLRLSTSGGPRDGSTWEPVQTLLDAAGPRRISIHSLRRDAISRALRVEP